jgi:uncharacterized membrane protein
MRIRPAIAACILCTLFLLATPLYYVHAQNHVQYQVYINGDGSAAWTITQAADTTGTIDTWQGFQLRISGLIASACSQTRREMGLDNNSLQMNTVWETQSHTTEYRFTWINFSAVESGKITFGAVFQVKDFFNRLYGDGEIQFFYPSTFGVTSVTPQPNGGDLDPQTLDWLGTEFFVNGNPAVVLSSVSSSPSPTPDLSSNGVGWQLYALAGTGVVVALAAALSVFVIRRRKPKTDNQPNSSSRIDPPVIESEEQKIIKALMGSGGSTYQSAIAEKCRFSKAKTSQLLTALEKKGLVTRYKRGRDKIVTLTEQGKGE